MMRAISSDSSGLPGTIVRRPDFPTPSASSPEDERHAILLPYPAVTLNTVLIQDGPDITTETYGLTEPPKAERTRASPCHQPSPNQDDGNQHHDQEPAMEFGAAAHNHLISSTKAGQGEQDTCLGL